MGLLGGIGDAIGLGGFGQDLVDGITGKSGERAALAAADAQTKPFYELLEMTRPLFESLVNPNTVNRMQQDGTIGGFDQNIGGILQSDAFKQLNREGNRNANAFLKSSGLSRSSFGGNMLKDIPIQTAMNLEGLLSNRRNQSLGFGSGLLPGIQNAMGSIGQANAGGILGANASRQQGIGNILGLIQGGLGALGGFSDLELKKDVHVVGHVGPLDIIFWEWNDKAKNDHGLEGHDIGFAAQQVLKHYPEHVTVKDGDYAIHYKELNDTLEAEYKAAA